MKPEEVEHLDRKQCFDDHGERKFEKKDEGDNFHRVERGYGSFTRSFTLPPTVSSENATAEFENGILHLTLVKREEAKPRRIEIKAGRRRRRQKRSKHKQGRKRLMLNFFSRGLTRKTRIDFF